MRTMQNEIVDIDDYHEYMCIRVYLYTYIQYSIHTYTDRYTAVLLPISNQSVGFLINGEMLDVVLQQNMVGYNSLCWLAH